MVYGHEDPLSPAAKFHLSSGLELKKVLDFKYLGTLLLSSMNDFKLRRAAVWSAIKRLNGIWKSTAISNHLKIRLFNCLVVSILLYNATTWTMNKTLTNALTGGYNRLLRHALNIFESAPQPIMDFLFSSMKGTRTQGNRSNYRKLLGEETLLDETSLQNAMLNRDHWRSITQ
jgi:hypothetical protein